MRSALWLFRQWLFAFSLRFNGFWASLLLRAVLAAHGCAWPFSPRGGAGGAALCVLGGSRRLLALRAWALGAGLRSRQHMGSVAVPRSTWGLPGSGIEPVSSVLSGRFFFFFLSFLPPPFFGNINVLILIGGSLLYNIILVLPYTDMNPPRVYTCSPF